MLEPQQIRNVSMLSHTHSPISANLVGFSCIKLFYITAPI